MNTKLYLASALTFMLIGCGGTNSGACCLGGIKLGQTAEGKAIVMVDKYGKTDPNTKIEAKVENKGGESNTPTSTVGLTSVSGDNNACQKNPCEFTVTQKASNCNSNSDKPNLEISECEKSAAESFLKDKLDAKKEIVVFGGTLKVVEESGQATSCGLNIEINLPEKWCGKELGTGEEAGFTGQYKNDDSVYVLITIANSDNCSVTVWKKAIIRNGKIILENLEGVQLPAKFTLFRITAMPDRFSGMTGIFN